MRRQHARRVGPARQRAQHRDARDAITQARAEVDRVAAQAPDEESRRMLLANVPEYARVVALTGA